MVPPPHPLSAATPCCRSCPLPSHLHARAYSVPMPFKRLSPDDVDRLNATLPPELKGQDGATTVDGWPLPGPVAHFSFPGNLGAQGCIALHAPGMVSYTYRSNPKVRRAVVPYENGGGRRRGEGAREGRSEGGMPAEFEPPSLCPTLDDGGGH